MSMPHSAISTCAVRSLTPGMVQTSSTSSVWAAVAVSMRASRVRTAWSRASIWASKPATRTPWWAVSKRLASASSSCGIFARSLPLASWASAAGGSCPCPARARWRRRCRGAHPGPRSAQRSHPSDDLLLRGQERAVWRGLLLTILRFALEAAVNNPAGPRAILLIGLAAPRGCRRQPDDAGILTPRRWRPKRRRDHSLPFWGRGNRWQPTATVFACLSRFRGGGVCHRLRPVATARLFLKKGRGSRSHLLVDVTSCVAPGRVAHLFLGVGRTPCRWELSRLLNSIRGRSGGQSQAGACRDRGAGRGSGRGLEGLVAGEHVPGGDQDLARDRGPGGVRVAGAATDVEG